MLRRAGTRGFSLVEVAIAIAVIAFAITSLLGLLSLGVHTNSDSSKEIMAANVAGTILDQRRADPEGVSSLYALPPLNTFAPLVTTGATPASPASPIYLTDAGQPTTVPSNYAYQLNYTITTSAAKVSLIDLTLTWPPLAPAGAQRGNYEIQTSIVLPPLP